MLLGVGYYLVFGLVIMPWILYRRRHATPRGTLRSRLSAAKAEDGAMSYVPTFVDHYDRPGAMAAAALPALVATKLKRGSRTRRQSAQVAPLPLEETDQSEKPGVSSSETRRPSLGGLFPSHPVANPVSVSPPHVRLSFHDICYDVPDRATGQKRLLHSVSGTVESGQLMALMGASGAGAARRQYL